MAGNRFPIFCQEYNDLVTKGAFAQRTAPDGTGRCRALCERPLRK